MKEIGNLLKSTVRRQERRAEQKCGPWCLPVAWKHIFVLDFWSFLSRKRTRPMPGHEGDLRTTKLVLRCLCFIIPFLTTFSSIAQLSTYNPIWTTPSKNSSQSMPVGGGDIGLNVWVENGDILFYVARSGTFDENNSLLKQGRVRLRLSPNPFENGDSFKQELILNDGYVKINGSY